MKKCDTEDEGLWDNQLVTAIYHSVKLGIMSSKMFIITTAYTKNSNNTYQICMNNYFP